MTTQEHFLLDHKRALARRWFLRDCGVGLGSIALASLLGERQAQAVNTFVSEPLAPRVPHFAPKAKRVIYLFMAGAPSHLELFDNKPALTKYDGTLPPAELLKGYRAAFINPNSALLGPKFKFARHGQSGAELSELLPHLASVCDDVCFVKSMATDAFNHAPGQILMNTGNMNFGRPSLGAWTLYGLGSEANDLPGFVVFSTGLKGTSGGAGNWGSAFLPSTYQGVMFRTQGEPVLYLTNPPGVDAQLQRDSLDTLRRLNEHRLAATGDPEIATRINSFEMAFRMQASAPELTDLSREPQHILEMYGAGPGKSAFANSCLMARRLVERGVRFVQLFHGGIGSAGAWDSHADIRKNHSRLAKQVDQPIAALIKDLKQRGLLDQTLILWAGEFGRTPHAPGPDGRDHHPEGFSVFLAGGGIKGGTVHGATDEFGVHAVDNVCDMHDLHATVLHLAGLDHERLTFRHGGRDFRLTDVHGRVIREILA